MNVDENLDERPANDPPDTQPAQPTEPSTGDHVGDIYTDPSAGTS